MANHSLACALIRGGTTKGVFINAADLPDDPVRRDHLLLALFGSPDARQINGLGGGDPLSSKVAIVSRPLSDELDVEYLSGEVGIDQGAINYSTFCGNLAAATALYALDAGWVQRTEPVTTIRIGNRNTGKRLTANIKLHAGVCTMGPCHSIDGAAGYGTEMNLTFHDPAGAITGHLLPTAQPVNMFTLTGRGTIRCSIVDCGTLYGFVLANELGVQADQNPLELDMDGEFKLAVESVREQIAFAVSASLGQDYSPHQVKVAIVGAGGLMPTRVKARVINRYKTHKAYPVSGAICLSAAAVIQGTVVQQLVGMDDAAGAIEIVHPSGAMTVSTKFALEQGGCKILHSVINRTARILMQGVAYAYLDEGIADYRRLSDDARIASPAAMQSS